MKKFVTYMLTVGISVFGVIALFNYFIDPSNIYSTDYIDRVIEGARRGLNVECMSDNMDERIYKRKLSELHRGETFDYVALGASHASLLSEDALSGASLLNLWVGGGTLEDITAFYQICKDNDIHYRNVIIPVDEYLLNDENTDIRWKPVASYYYKFMGQEVTEERFDWDKVWNLFSASYFQASLKFLMVRLSGVPDIRYVLTVENEGSTRRTDGSIYYERKNRERAQNLIDKEALQPVKNFDEYKEVSQRRISIFCKLMDALKADGVNVIFFRSPLHPIVYERTKHVKGMAESRKFFTEYAEKNGITLIGSYNPADLGLKNTDFHVGSHLKKEVVDRLFSHE